MKSERYYLPNKIDLSPASVHQKKYAESLGVKIPPNVTKSDIQALIDLQLDEDITAPTSLFNFATHCDIHASSYSSNKYLYNLLFDNLKPLDQVAFFCFCIYHYLVNDEDYNLSNHIHKELFYNFATLYTGDLYFTASMKEYYGEELITFGKNTFILSDGTVKNTYGGSIHTRAYKVAFTYITENLALTIPRFSPLNKKDSPIKKFGLLSKLFKK